MHLISNFESDMISMERISQYTDKPIEVCCFLHSHISNTGSEYQYMIFLSQDTVNSKIFARVIFSQNFKIKLREIAKSLCHLLMKVNHVIVAIFLPQNMSFSTI